MVTKAKKSAKLTRDQIVDLVKAKAEEAGGLENLSGAEVLSLQKETGLTVEEFLELFEEAAEAPTSFAGSSEVKGISPSKGKSVKYEIMVGDHDEDPDHQFLVVAYIPPSIARRDLDIYVEIDPDSPKVNLTKVS
ncbi:MAG: hypothetical protein EP299_01850 [Acidobacteria bacterium]|nr:MAG: hypothetical protein EP299_01850 [Acidobacteriota bacterium]